jgi:hypothetical protein
MAAASLLGAAPGVGKTYEMLQTARARRKDGYDVVTGTWRRTGARKPSAAGGPRESSRVGRSNIGASGLRNGPRRHS